MTLIAGHHPTFGILKFTQPQQVSKIEPELGSAHAFYISFNHLSLSQYMLLCGYRQISCLCITMSEAFLIIQFTPVWSDQPKTHENKICT